MSVTTDGVAHEFTIDKELCSGHGRCYSLAPQWFRADDKGYGEPFAPAAPGTPRADMEFIADSCPEEAISFAALSEQSPTNEESK